MRRMVLWAASVLAVMMVAGAVASGSRAMQFGGKPTASDLLPAGFLSNKKPEFKPVGPRGGMNGQSHARWGLTNIDSLPNWNDHYFADGLGPTGLPQQEWFTNTLGNPPEKHGTTTIGAPIVPVIVSLRDTDGSQRYYGGQPMISSPVPYVQPVLNSPLFQNSTYSSSPVPTQLTDAVQRAEYFGRAKSDWHTLLAPSVKAPLQLNLARGTYRFLPNPDGTCCAFILVDFAAFDKALFPATYTFPPDNSTVVGQAENNGDITTKDLSTFLFPDTYLYYNGDPTQCCVPGFHTFDEESGDASNGNRPRDYVLNYSTWISPGVLSGPGDEWLDIPALSHEIAETFNDPFVASDGVHNVTPWWLAPFACGDDREVGDVIQGRPNELYPMTMNGFTYHPQNEALLPYFEFQQPSSAIDGAYSYPNESVLSGPPTPQNVNCQ